MRNVSVRVPLVGILIVIVSAGSAAVQAGEAPLDLAALLAEADASAPRIRAARARLDAAGHTAGPLEAAPDPLAMVSYTNDGLSQLTLGDSIMSNLTFSWSQEMPYPGKRRLAGDVARAEAGVVEVQLEAERRAVRADLKSSYLELWRIDRARQIVAESRSVLETVEEAARARYENGQGILEPVLRARTEVTRIGVEVIRLEQQRATTVAAINALLNRGQAGLLGPAVDLPTGNIPDRSAAETAASERSTALLAIRQQAAAQEARLSVARKSLKPDFVWSAAYMFRADIDPMVMGAFGVRLPLHKDTRQAEQIVEAGILLEAARRDEEGAMANLFARISDLIAQARRAEELSRLYADGLLPQARDARDASLAAYENGRTDLTTVLGNQLTVLRDTIEYENQRAERLRLLVELEPLTGLELVVASGGRS